MNDCPSLLEPPGMPFEACSYLEFVWPRLLGLVFWGLVVLVALVFVRVGCLVLSAFDLL